MLANNKIGLKNLIQTEIEKEKNENKNFKI
jgi:hypothetical protein